MDTMAKNATALNTLKDCLQFLEWLHGDKLGQQMKGLISSRLKRLLDKRYNTVDPSQIEKALSTFLSSVHTFHTKLCKSPQPKYTGPQTAKNALNALLDCIPKLLAAVYFLRYQVDANFAALGGGGWKDDGQVGWVEMYARMRQGAASMAGPVDKYLIASSGDTTYGGIIPGGFAPGDLKPGYLQGGYSPASQMAGDLQNILEKETNAHNLFRDVYSTTVIPDSGAGTPNVANALRLVQDFCRIFGEVTNEIDFKMHLYSKDKCIEWDKLQAHCKKLISPLEQIFTGGRFSFTGYGREYEKLNKQDVAKKMASWFKKHLETVKEKLAQIKAFSSVKDSKKLKSGKPLTNQHSTALQNYFTKQFIPYGFTFYGHQYNKNAPYDLLKGQWDTAISELQSSDGGLQRLVDILNGEQCKAEEEQRKQRQNDDDQPEEIDEELLEEPEDEELKDGKIVTLPKPGAAKPVITKAEAAKPTATGAEGAQNQGKKAEGAQNQGKKSEGAQNQGKKTGVDPNQNNGQSEEKSPALPVGKPPAPAQSSDVKGAPGPSGPAGPEPPGSSSAPGSSGNQIVQVQKPDTVSPVPPPLLAAPAPAGQPGVGQGSPGGDAPTPQPVSPKDTVLAQPTGVPGSDAGITGGKGTRQDSGQGVGQPTTQPSDLNSSGVATTSVVPASDPGSGGSEGSPQDTVKEDPCPSAKGFTKIKLWPNSSTYCVRTADYDRQDEINKKWYDKVKHGLEAAEERKRQDEKEKQQKEAEERQLQEEVEEYKRKLLQGMQMETKILNEHPGIPTYADADKVKAKTMLRSGYTPVDLKEPGFTPSVPDGNGITGGRGVPDSMPPPAFTFTGHPLDSKKMKNPVQHPPPEHKPLGQLLVPKPAARSAPRIKRPEKKAPFSAPAPSLITAPVDDMARLQFTDISVVDPSGPSRSTQDVPLPPQIDPAHHKIFDVKVFLP
ncbi:Ribosome-binding protein 1, putative [Babesia ovata]|uniref:Ribosome-binding protein 1, putative n=1 Tax=Babesia ovata TaxID=189622 RepID=A0A2H6KAP7_9APIC|nr:Ribosome-binding protein 1, putative [Babesia ovata]GBE60056.1 Ribosome-binding protein 1, putative [Babesia ovata]